jgi:putative ABC transport system substrate-binding protein
VRGDPVIDRRKAIIAIGAGGLLMLAGRVSPQSGKPARIAMFSTGSSESHGYLVEAFRKAMRELGYVEGRDVVYDYYWADGRTDRAVQLATRLARTKPDVIVTGTAVFTRAAVDAVPTATVVMAYGSDPVGNGLVASLSRPGGRVTGLSNLAEGITPKMLELMQLMVPHAQRLVLLVNPANLTTGTYLAEADAAAKSLRLSAVKQDAATPDDIGPAFERIARERPQGIVVTPDPLFLTTRTRLVALAARARLPAIYFQREFVEAGGLMSYGASISAAFARAATFVDKVLKGANPGELPVEQPTKFELVVNLKTAKSLGLPIPQPLLVRADEVIR